MPCLLLRIARKSRNTLCMLADRLRVSKLATTVVVGVLSLVVLMLLSISPLPFPPLPFSSSFAVPCEERPRVSLTLSGKFKLGHKIGMHRAGRLIVIHIQCS